MEIFLDGGLFELIIIMGAGTLINFIFKRKMLLIIYSTLSIGIPVLLLFIGKSEIKVWLQCVPILNSMLLIVILWMQKSKEPDKPLFQINKPILKLFKRHARNHG